MKLSLPLPNMMHLAALTQPWEYDLTGADLVTVAKLADELGFEAISVSEHLIIPNEHMELTGDHWLDPPSAQAFVAGATSNIRLNTGLSILPLRHPVLTAKALATLDYLSGGRAMITVGVGWLEPEFEIMNVPFNKRGRVADEYLEAIFELLDNDSPSYEGEFISFNDVGFSPKPIQKPHPPIWVGGDSPAAMHRAARFGDGWSPWQTKPEELPARLEQIKSDDVWVDRPFDVYYALASLTMGDDHEILDVGENKLAATAEEIIDQCGRLTALGATETWINPPVLPDFQAYLDHLRWVAAEIMPKIA